MLLRGRSGLGGEVALVLGEGIGEYLVWLWKMGFVGGHLDFNFISS